MRKLSDVVRDIKTAQADRDDVVIDMRESQRMRLELMLKEIQPIVDDIPAQNQLFDFAISSGEQPRLWIDATAHVVMGRDKRTFRFVHDTHLGRKILAESIKIEPVADQVTRYIAERIIERERMIAGDRYGTPIPPQNVNDTRPADVFKTTEPSFTPVKVKKTGFFKGIALLVLGTILGGCIAGALVISGVIAPYWAQFLTWFAALS